MALAGTHIRFALDVRTDFDVVDERKYVAGAVYPDSRYPTGIDRDLTHGDNQMQREFWHDDEFRKGWASHLLYDHIQTAVRHDWFPQLHRSSNPDLSGEEGWVNGAAIKLLQDINDVTTVDIRPCLQYLEHVETPNGEDEETVRAFNYSFRDLYQQDISLRVDSMKTIAADWSMAPERIAMVVAKAEIFANDRDILNRINTMYDETMRRKDEFFAKYCV